MNEKRVGAFSAYSLEELSDPSRATNVLAHSLVRGELALYLGAGVGRGSGLPGWGDLVLNCEREAGIVPPSMENENVQRDPMDIMRGVRRRVEATGGSARDFRELVRRGLYPDAFLSEETYPDSCLQDLTLIALGSMIMSSSRGSIREVVTLNFDDLLEWYLEFHGFTTQPVTELPTLLRADVDVTILHPHGYLPLELDRSETTSWLVLTRDEYVRRLSGTSGRAWPRFLTNLFTTKKLLAVGTSLSDIDFQAQLDESREERPEGAGPSRFVLNAEFGDDEVYELQEAGLVPVSVGQHAEIPKFLLGVCRRASEIRQ